MWVSLRRPLGRLLLLAACFFMLAGGAAPAPPPPPRPQAPPADLSPKYTAWVEEVAPLISDRERQGFLSLTRDYQRDDFIQRFCDVRDPLPAPPRNDLRHARA